MAGRGCSLVARRRSASKRISRKENPGEDRGGGKSAEDLGPRGAAGHCPRARRLAGRVPDSSGAHRTGPKVLKNMFLLVVLSLLVLADSVSRNLEERIPSKTTAPQQSLEQMCPPGSYLSEVTRRCTPCRLGVTYTSYSNSLPYCLICSECKPDYEEETHTCTLTRDKICGCKAGTFYKDDSPEFCRKCSPRCPEGMVEDSPCTPNSDRKCIPRKAGIEPWKIGMIVLGVIGLLLALGCWCVPRCWRGLQGREQSEQGHKQTLAVCLRHLGNCVQCRGPEQQAADQLDPEQRMEGQEQDRMAGACEQIPVEGEPLLEDR